MARRRHDEINGLDREQVSNYLRRPNHCPFCGSEEIHASSFEPSGKHIYNEIECTECERRWNDVYELVTIESIEEPD
jgi:transcription elongation factor Elf1